MLPHGKAIVHVSAERTNVRAKDTDLRIHICAKSRNLRVHLCAKSRNLRVHICAEGRNLRIDIDPKNVHVVSEVHDGLIQILNGATQGGKSGLNSS